MKRNKELFFNFQDNGKLNLKLFKNKPSSFNHFRNVISELTLVNIKNEDWLRSFYNKYVSEIFPRITSRKPSDYSKYFWNLECIGLNYPSSSDSFYISRGWSADQIKKLRSDKYATSSIDFQKKKFNLSEDEAVEKINKRQILIKEKRNKTYKKYLENDPDYFKKVSGYSKDKFIAQGYSQDEAELLYKKASNKVSFKNKVWADQQRTGNSEYWKSRTTTQLEYWIKKCDGDVELAKIMLKDRQVTFSLEKCIQKYGEVEGKRKWIERQEKWKSKVFNEHTYLGGGRSYIATDFFKQLILHLNLSTDLYMFDKNEKHIRDSVKKITYKYDFTYIPNKKIIEFNGDYWHCNPAIYESSYYHKIKKMTAQQIWDYDNSKIKLAEQHGYKTFTVTEYEYIKDTETTINNCIKFLYDK